MALPEHQLTMVAALCVTARQIATFFLSFIGLGAIVITDDFIRDIQDLKFLGRFPPGHLAHRRMVGIQAPGMLSPESNLETPFAGFVATATCTAGRSRFVAFALLASAIETSRSCALVLSGLGSRGRFHKSTAAGADIRTSD